MKNQALFTSKDKSKKLKCRLLQFLFGTSRVKPTIHMQCLYQNSKTLLYWFLRNLTEI